MYTSQLARKREEDERKRKAQSGMMNVHRSKSHRRLTNDLSSKYRQRVDAWMVEALSADVPPLPPKPLDVNEMSVAPWKFYRNTPASSSATSSNDNSRCASPKRTRRRRKGIDASGDMQEWSLEEDHHHQLHSPSSSPSRRPRTSSKPISSRPYQTESERIAAYLANSANQYLSNDDPYMDPSSASASSLFRPRVKHAELSGPLAFRPRTSSARIREEIEAHGPGGRSSWEYEELKEATFGRGFRTEAPKDMWMGNKFVARQPKQPVFSEPEHVSEPYQPATSARDLFRSSTQQTPPSSHRFLATIRPDQFLPDPDAIEDPDDDHAQSRGLQRTLERGLYSSGIYQLSARQPQGMQLDTGEMSPSGSVKSISTRPSHTYWKAAITMAHQPSQPLLHLSSTSSSSSNTKPLPLGGSQSARPHAGDTDVAQHLLRTYRQHLAY